MGGEAHRNIWEKLIHKTLGNVNYLQKAGKGSRAVVPNLFFFFFGTRDQFHRRKFFFGQAWGEEGGFGMIQAHCI